MDKETLRKVQLTQLEILKEIDRICKKHDIQYFLTAGTLLGAIRHKGFIPWDDDLDIAMLKDQYDKFCRIAPKEFCNDFYLQNWDTDKSYPFEYGKVRKRNTVYIEDKSDVHKKPGIFVDVIVYANAPASKKERDKLYQKMLNYRRMLLCLCNYRPWIENGKVNIKKRVGYIFYGIHGRLLGRERIIKKFNAIRERNSTGFLFPMLEGKKCNRVLTEWYNNCIYQQFEDAMFPISKHYDDYLTTAYGDYMKLPPEDQRENRHQIIEVKV